VPPDRESRPFVTAPLPDDEVERLLRVVDERVRLRGTAAELPAWDPDVLDPAATYTGESLRDLAAPLFQTATGSPLVRAAKAALNVPLGVLGRPQAYFNDAVRRVVAAWADVLGATLDNLAALQREVAAQRARLAELEARLERGDRQPPS
jgi:hypothetical protein